MFLTIEFAVEDKYFPAATYRETLKVLQLVKRESHITHSGKYVTYNISLISVNRISSTVCN